MKNSPVKYKFKFNSSQQSCDSTAWTEFYNYGFTNSVLLSEIIIKLNNTHLLKIEFGDNVIEVDVGKLIKFINDGKQTFENTSKFIKYTHSSKDKCISFELYNWYGTNLKLYQKRKNGSGNLKMEGYILTYFED